MYLHVTIMLTLQTTVAVCTVTRHTGKLCMGAVGRHRRQPATLKAYKLKLSCAKLINFTGPIPMFYANIGIDPGY